MIALALIRHEGTSRGPSLLAGRFSRCNRAGCADEKPEEPQTFTHANAKHDGRDVIIPSGKYRLYVITDGAPVRVSLRLRGLSGSARLNVTKPSDARVVMPEFIASAVEQHVIYSAGDSNQMSKRGLSYAVAWAEASPTLEDQRGICEYKGAAPAPDAVAYSPLCPFLGASHFAITTPGPVDGLLFISDVNFNLTPGTWSRGFYFASPGIIEKSGAFVVWMEY